MKLIHHNFLFQSWFTRLPPVLTFDLSRFQFNQQFGHPEKIHNEFQFPAFIWMDRYAHFWNYQKLNEISDLLIY